MVYSTADAVLPVLSALRALPVANPVTTGAVEMAASAAVSVGFHRGYPEFRGPAMVHPLVGDVISLGLVVTGNPLAAVTVHATMNTVAVLQGAEGTVQLPPHYEERSVA